MIRIVLCLCLAAIVGTLMAPHGAVADQELFIEKKCNMCHSITSLDVAAKKKKKVLDLSKVGADHDAAFFAAYLKKEKAHVAHEGLDSVEKHKVKFKGSDEEATKLGEWLTTLK